MFSSNVDNKKERLIIKDFSTRNEGTYLCQETLPKETKDSSYNLLGNVTLVLQGK